MLQDAASHFELVIQGYTKLLGPENPETIDASYRLKRCVDARWTPGVVQLTLMGMMGMEMVAVIVAVGNGMMETTGRESHCGSTPSAATNSRSQIFGFLFKEQLGIPQSQKSRQCFFFFF